jgi:transcriptional regulator with XRE-family HTH domain
MHVSVTPGPDPVYVHICHRIREARRAVNMTQEQLGQKLSLSRTSVANIEKGRQQVLVHTLLLISRELRVSVDSLVPEEPEEKAHLDLPGDLSAPERKFVLSVVNESKKKK